MITLRNRQRLLKIDAPRLKTIAEQLAGRPLTIVFVTDRVMARLNEQFHHTACPTDVLTFDYGAEADLVISVERAMAQAKRYRTTVARELALYVIHGILHLRGYADHTPRQRARMRAAEKRLLRRYCAAR